MSVAPTSRVFADVALPADACVEDFVLLGKPGADPAPTRIGQRALIRSHTVIYAGTVIGDGFRTGHHVMIREQTRIGRDVSIGTGTVIEHHVVIEDGVRIHSNAFVPEFTTLEAGCWLGPNVVLTNARYPRSAGVKEALAGPTIRRGAILGAGCTVLPGVVVGERAIVGAGAVVVRDVAPGDVVAGNPARVINRIERLPYDR